MYEELTNKKYENVDHDYNQFLVNHENITANCGDIEAKIYPLAHCGGMGTANRNRNLPKQNDPLYYQKQDWERIARENKMRCY